LPVRVEPAAEVIAVPAALSMTENTPDVELAEFAPVKVTAVVSLMNTELLLEFAVSVPTFVLIGLLHIPIPALPVSTAIVPETRLLPPEVLPFVIEPPLAFSVTVVVAETVSGVLPLPRAMLPPLLISKL
jgi:hypothetical protein